MDQISDLIAVADAYGSHTNRGRKRVSTLVFNQGGRLDEFASDERSPNHRTIKRAMQWFSDNWPEGKAWPHGVERPDKTMSVAA